MNQEFLNVKKAADYCGYNGKYFGKLSASYKIPRYGPRRNKFKRYDLDLFMEHPEIFIEAQEHTRGKYRLVTL